MRYTTTLTIIYAAAAGTSTAWLHLMMHSDLLLGSPNFYQHLLTNSIINVAIIGFVIFVTTILFRKPSIVRSVIYIPLAIIVAAAIVSVLNELILDRYMNIGAEHIFRLRTFAIDILMYGGVLFAIMALITIGNFMSKYTKQSSSDL